jgi:hypothetical protein
MTIHYTADSAPYLGTTHEPECAGTSVRRHRDAARSRGLPLVPSGRPECRGAVVWAWTHSGWGTHEQPLCEACLAWVASGAAPYHLSGEHALFRDSQGAWRLRDGSRLV